MAREVATIIGSGTVPQTYGILPPESRGFETDGLGVRAGTQTVLANPEDINSVDAWSASGVTVGTAAVVELIGPHTNPLPRCRAIAVGNTTTNTTLYIGPWNDLGRLVAEGIPLPVGASSNSEPFGIRIPLLHNNFIYGVAVGGTVAAKMLIY